MYISNTTQEQRRIIDSALDGMYFKVRRAHNLLGRVWDDYFGTANQEAISSSEAEHLGELIYTIDDIIWSAALEYALVIGDRDFPGIEPHLRGAEAARKAMEVEKLDSEVFDLTKSLKPEPREALLAKRREIAQLPDDEAAPPAAGTAEREGGLKNESRFHRAPVLGLQRHGTTLEGWTELGRAV